MKKRILGILLAAAMLFNSDAIVFAENTVNASQETQEKTDTTDDLDDTEDKSGEVQSQYTIGTNVKVEFLDNKAVISGEGDIYDFDESGYFGNTQNPFTLDNYKTIDEIEISDNITHIGANIFAGCSNIEQVTIPVQVISIGDKAFKDCTNLEKINITDSVTQIGNDTFTNCGKLTIYATADSYAGSYAIQHKDNGIAFISTSPNLTKVIAKGTSNTLNSIELTWDLQTFVSDNSGYYIYRYNSEGVKVDMAGNEATEPIYTLKNNVASHIIEGLTTGENYYFSVAAYEFCDANQKIYIGEESEKVNVIPVFNAVSITKIESSSYKSIKITWQTNKDAKQYEVYRAASLDGKYSKVATVSETSYTDSDSSLVCGSTYYYKVRCVNENTYTSYSEVKSQKLIPSTPNIKVTRGTALAKVTIKWDKVSGANGYKIYKSAAEDSGYKELTTIKSGNTVSFVDKDVKAGETYYYKVRVYRTVNNSKVYSKYSKIKKISVIPSKVTISSASSIDYKTLEIKWTQNTKADGYVLYYATSEKGSYKKLETFTKNTTLSYKLSSLTSGSKYYFKIRTYKKVNSKNIYSSYSDIKEGTPVPAAPKDLTITRKNSNKLVLAWKSVAGAKSYVIMRKSSSGASYEIYKKDIKELTYTDSGLTNATTYYYKVYAVRGNANGKKSSEVKQKASSLKISDTSITIISGNKITITATPAPGATSKWSSANTKIAKVSSKGVITGLKAGSTNIYCEANGIIRTIKVKVKVVANGIDVSYHNGNINWNSVKNDNVDVAVLRCGYGSDYTSQDDIQFLNYAKACEKYDITYGVYLYSYATSKSQAKSEAKHVIRTLKGRDLNYPIFLDMEDATQGTLSPSALGDIAETFVNTLRAYGYTNVGVYANYSWWTTKLTDSRFEDWHRWVARYNSYCGYDKTYMGWQYSSSGSVNGIGGAVDMNYFYLD